MKNKYFKPIVLVVYFFALASLLVVSYAFFSVSVGGNSEASDTVITTGNMSLLFTDSTQIDLDNAIPGTSVTKTFKIKNNGTIPTTYDVYLSEILNDFIDKNDLVYILSSPTGCSNLTETVVPEETGDQSKIVSSCAINPNVEHEYTLTITFKDDNTNQDDNKGKTFSAKISVNEYKVNGDPLIQKIIDLKTNGSTELEYDGTETLGDLGTVDNNLRYVGENPNNYVEFNNELWRIIGLMNNVQKEDGTTESLIKIRRAESLGTYSWDSSDSSTNRGDGINQWGPSGSYEGADLMRELNTDYLGSVTVGTNGKWYSGMNNSKTSEMPSNTINDLSKSMIEKVVWKLGSPNNNNGTSIDRGDSLFVAHFIYEHERLNYGGKLCSSGNYCNDRITRKNTWIGLVGLFYPSDYFYATSGGETTSRLTCLNMPSYNSQTNNWFHSTRKDCKNNDWLYTKIAQWTLSPASNSNYADSVFEVDGDNVVTPGGASELKNVYPVVFLKSSVIFTKGDGSELNPYKLVM